MKEIAFLLALAATSAPVAARQIQVNVPGVNVPNPGSNDIAVDSNHNTRTITCKPGGGLFVRGNSNTLQVSGACTVVHVLGNKNVITIAQTAKLITEGNSNVVSYAGSKTEVSNPGNHNVVSAGH